MIGYLQVCRHHVAVCWQFARTRRLWLQPVTTTTLTTTMPTAILLQLLLLHLVPYSCRVSSGLVRQVGSCKNRIQIKYNIQNKQTTIKTEHADISIKFSPCINVVYYRCIGELGLKKNRIGRLLIEAQFNTTRKTTLILCIQVILPTFTGFFRHIQQSCTVNNYNIYVAGTMVVVRGTVWQHLVSLVFALAFISFWISIVDRGLPHFKRTWPSTLEELWEGPRPIFSSKKNRQLNLYQNRIFRHWRYGLVHCEAKKLHPSIFAVTLSNRIVFW